MKKEGLIITALLFSIISLLPAQEALHRSLSLSWGTGNLKRQDLTFSPMIHQKWSPVNFIFEYTRAKKLEQNVSVQFGQYRPIIGEQYDFFSFYNGESSTYPHVLSMIDINYSLGKKVAENKSWDLTVGGRSRNRLLGTDYNFGEFNSFGYYFSFGLDLWLQVQMEAGEKHHIKAHMALPVFSYNCRSYYLWHTDEHLWENYSHNGLKAFANYLSGGEIQSWGQSQGADLDVQYFYELSEKWQIGGRYLFSMSFNQDPTRFAQVENVLYLTAKMNLN
ncbi:MAG: hypothetical protein H6563_16500 [Lewinellaceae bacterium]|nr:hypothetical protein [Lewinellaceae bacterium]